MQISLLCSVLLLLTKRSSVYEVFDIECLFFEIVSTLNQLINQYIFPDTYIKDEEQGAQQVPLRKKKIMIDHMPEGDPMIYQKSAMVCAWV